MLVLFTLFISLLLKIPSNREDLMIQSFLENELKTIFLFEFYNTWKIIKPDYSFVLKEIYSKYRPLQLSNIIDPFKATVYYKIQITFHYFLLHLVQQEITFF